MFQGVIREIYSTLLIWARAWKHLCLLPIRCDMVEAANEKATRSALTVWLAIIKHAILPLGDVGS